MKFLQLLVLWLMACGQTQEKVLNDIISILAENPRTRSLFLRTIATHKYPQPRIRFIRPVSQRYVYALSRPVPQLLEDAIAGGPVNPAIPPYPLRRPVLPCSNTNPQLPNCPTNQNQDVSGVALDINGDMKQNIPYKIVTSAPIETELDPASAKGIQNRLVSKKLFQKKRTIIKELKSLFRVILDNEFSDNLEIVRPRKVRTHVKHPHEPVNETAVKTEKVAVSGDSTNSSSVSQGAKRGRISLSPQGGQVGKKRVVLYRKLINDLNDLITLEINKNNKTNSFEGVEQLAPSKLRSTISRTPDNLLQE